MSPKAKAARGRYISDQAISGKAGGSAEPVYITDQIIKVRPNLVAALKHFCGSENVYQVWVDALCIDQKNTEERNHQVSLMDAIYSKPRGVLSLLGEQSETSHLAITHLNRVNEIFQIQNRPGDELNAYSLGQPEIDHSFSFQDRYLKLDLSVEMVALFGF